MSILNAQPSGEGKTPGGKRIQIPPQVALLQRGPVVQVSASVGQVLAQQIIQNGGAIPPPVTGLALIDTGATTTCIDQDAAETLKLPAIDVVKVASASHASSEQNVYPISIEFVGFPFGIHAPRAIGALLKAQGLLLLIGRDALQACVLIYNGTTGAVYPDRLDPNGG